MASALTQMQRRHGSYSRDRFQKLRKQFYSFVEYPAAGASELIFFGSPVSATTNRQLTNIPKAGSFGTNHFLIKAIHTDFIIGDQKLDTYANTDATTLFGDLVHGFAQAGYMELKVGSKTLIQMPKPFLQAPPGHGTTLTHSAGGISSTGSPLTAITVDSPTPHAELARKSDQRYKLHPNVLIEAEQQFELKITYPSGVIPIIGTSVQNDSTNKVYVGVIFDGIIYRPLQ